VSDLRRATLTVLAGILAVYGVVYADVWLRARSAYQEGEKYLEWDRRPELKAASLDRFLAEKQARLQTDEAAGRLTAVELEERLALARFERDEAMKESSLKYAYVWFQTAVELFSPPESRWVVRSRRQMAVAKELWKKELDAKKIPHQDYMLE